MPFTAGDICKIFFAIILPPVVFIPGLIHALYIILKYERLRHTHSHIICLFITCFNFPLSGDL
ncbi:hypothetical protein LB505_008085 [Fusarium chuoi]|nr:hypothetical protein LB505_008085 [Fusarium chuoi]